MLKSMLTFAALVYSLIAQAQSVEDCQNMAKHWSDIFTNAAAVESMTALFSPNALVFGTGSKELGTTKAEVVAYFTPAYNRKPRYKNEIISQQTIQIAASVWVLAGLYEFTSLATDGVKTVIPARFHFVVVRDDGQCKIAAFNSSRVPS